MLSKRRILGLAVNGRSITAVELTPLNGGADATRAAEFVFPDGLGLQEPARLGKALRQFLKDNKFGASRCILGLDARALTARDKALPPGVGDQVRQVLSLAVEREFASDIKDLVVDYAPADHGRDTASALLVAAPRVVIEQLTTMTQTAGLRAEGITASTMALAAGSAEPEQLILRVFGGGAELLTESPTGVRTMRPLTVPPAKDGATGEWLDSLVAELRRVVMLLPDDTSGNRKRQLLIWNEAQLDEGDRDILADRLGLSARLESVPTGVHTNGLGASHLPGQFCAASAVALAGVKGQDLPVNFLRSRLSPTAKSALGRQIALGAALAGILVLAGAWLVWDWQNDRAEIARMNARISLLAPARTEAQSVIKRTKLARTWYDRRPAFLECVKEITLAFPSDGIIWATRVTIQDPEEMKVVLAGKAVSETAVLDVLDRIKENPRMSQVKSLYLRQAGRDGREKAFAVSFSYGGSD